jgi:hypothetical protein
MAMGYKLCHTLAARSPTVAVRHVCFNPSFVNEYEFVDFKTALHSLPSLPMYLNVGPMLFTSA